jgi:hypothetical protein
VIRRLIIASAFSSPVVAALGAFDGTFPLWVSMLGGVGIPVVAFFTLRAFPKPEAQPVPEAEE